MDEKPSSIRTAVAGKLQEADDNSKIVAENLNPGKVRESVPTALLITKLPAMTVGLVAEVMCDGVNLFWRGLAQASKKSPQKEVKSVEQPVAEV